MLAALLLWFLVQEPKKSTTAPIEPPAKTEADAKRLSQYPSLGGGLYNIDAVPEEVRPDAPLPAARDPYYQQKRVIGNLAKRLWEAGTLLQAMDARKVDRVKTLKKVSGLLRDMERDFAQDKKSRVPASNAGDLQEVSRLLTELNVASRSMNPEVRNVDLLARLSKLAGSAAAITEALSKVPR